MKEYLEVVGGTATDCKREVYYLLWDDILI
jgi:hypothetical protein